MPPPPAATAAPVRRHAGGSTSSRRWVPLRAVPSRRGQPGRIRQLFANRRRVLNIVSVSIVVASLLAVVVAQALLANGQVRLSSLQHQLSLEQSAHRQAELAVSGLETPPRIVSAATSQGMVHPANVVELPYVSLSVPVSTPKVTPAPAAPPPTTTATTSSSSAGGAGATSTAGGTSSGSAATGATTGTGATSSTTTATSTP
jgi:cell division protein FtsL